MERIILKIHLVFSTFISCEFYQDEICVNYCEMVSVWCVIYRIVEVVWTVPIEMVNRLVCGLTSFWKIIFPLWLKNVVQYSHCGFRSWRRHCVEKTNVVFAYTQFLSCLIKLFVIHQNFEWPSACTCFRWHHYYSSGRDKAHLSLINFQAKVSLKIKNTTIKWWFFDLWQHLRHFVCHAV